MSTRRPRIKASANLALASKRKAKNSTDTPEPTKLMKEEELIQDVKTIVVEENVFEPVNETPNQSPVTTFSTIPPCEPTPPPLDSQEIPNKNPSEVTRLQPFQDAFKYPQNPEYKRPSAVVPIDENTASDFEDNILHMDLQKSPGFPMSPTKSRQRIRPTPIFGQRRNSFVGTSPSPHTEDTDTTSAGSTRQRSSNSTSSDVQNNFLMRKLAAGNLGRIRTESGCSTISESKGTSRKSANDTKRWYNGRMPDKSSMKMFDLIYYNPTTNPMEQKAPGTAAAVPEVAVSESGKEDDPPAPEIGATSAMPVPQLKLGSNGEMMIDEQSLEIETTAEVEARKVLANSSLIYHDENTGSEGFYRKHKRTKDWPHDETIKFYRCLQTVGTDFSLMLTLFPNRTRRDLKLKFKKEERCNLTLINKALLYPGAFNIEDLQGKLEAEEEERKEQERQWKEIKMKEGKQIKKLRNAPSSSSRVLISGDEIYQNENITKAKLAKRKIDCVGVLPVKEKRKRRQPPPPASVTPTRSSVSIDESSLLETELAEILNSSIISGDTMDSMKSETADLNEASISLILNELASGTLAFVSSVDPANPDKTVNEIYIMCKESGQLNDTPLELSEEIVDAIRLVMTSS